MSGAHNHQPIAALLRSHPEECADVCAALCARGEAQHGVNDRTPTALAIVIWPDGDIEEHVDLVRSILAALDDAGATSHVGTMYRELAERDRYAIARQGAAAWLAARCGVTTPARIAGRYDDRKAIAARVAAVLGCAPDRVSLGWRSSELESIGVPGAVLEGESVAALIKAGFEPSSLGWDVPGDVGETGAEVSS